MKQYERRLEIMRILVAKRKTTARELVDEFGVAYSTIRNDISVLSLRYPIYTKPGLYGGIFIMDTYRQYKDSLTRSELDTLRRLHKQSKGKDKENLLQIMHRYGPDKLEIQG